jgi:hypothetical protein
MFQCALSPDVILNILDALKFEKAKLADKFVAIWKISD